MTETMTEKASFGWVSITRVAEELGSTPLNVLMHIKRGLLVGVEKDGHWLVETRSLAALLRRKLAGETPAVCSSRYKKAHGCGGCG
jgi:hypothetical protein